jgi:purine nucleoside permease
VKVIVLCGFEVGADSGDEPGEFQYWVERDHMDEALVVLGAPHVLRRNTEGLYGSVGEVANVSHQSTTPHSELVMAICLDPRFDLRKTYWILTGIGGIDPAFGPIGSAVWSENIVDADVAMEIDDREIPSAWPYGLLPLGSPAPNQPPQGRGYSMNFALNAKLARWAYAFTKDMVIPDAPELKARRMLYTGFPNAQFPPKVMLGDTVGTARYWYGVRRTQWARDWVKLWTQGRGTFATIEMETQNYAGTLSRLSDQGIVDFNRVLQLRAASDITQPPAGESIVTSMGDESVGRPTAFEAEYRVGSAVAHEILRHWDRYENTIPGSESP